MIILGSGTLCNQPHGNGSSNILSQSSLERHSVYLSSLPTSDHPLATPLDNDPQTSDQRLSNSGQHSGDWMEFNKHEVQNSMSIQPNKENVPNLPNLS